MGVSMHIVRLRVDEWLIRLLITTKACVPQLGRCPYLPLPLCHINPLSFENGGDRVVVPPLTLPPCGYLHGIQEHTDGSDAYPFGVHLLDGSDGARLTIVIYDLATDAPLAIS